MPPVEAVTIKPSRLVDVSAGISIGLLWLFLSLPFFIFFKSFIWFVILGVFALLLGIVYKSHFKITAILRHGNSSVSISAPFCNYLIPITNVSEVTIEPDNGENPGLINWPVLGRAKANRGVRLNVGGSFVVRVIEHTGRRFNIVTANHAQAQTLATLFDRE